MTITADSLLYKDKIPLLTLVDAYAEMSGDPVRDNGYDFYQEIPLENVINYISSSKKQIPGSVITTAKDQHGRIFLSELDVITQTDIQVNSLNGNIQFIQKKNLYVKEARGIK